MATTYEKIASTTLGSASANITFSSISSAYTDLRLVFVGTWTGSATALRTTINSTTSGGLYSYTQLQGDGASPFSGRATSQNSYDVPGSSTTVPTMATMDFFSYAGSTFKTFLCERSADLNGSGITERDVVLFRSTSAITTINLAAAGTTFAAGTTATLYGILKA